MIQTASNPVGSEETQCPQCPVSQECPVCQECPECQGEVGNQETEEICPATGSCILMSSFCKPNLLRKCSFFVTHTFRHSRGGPTDLLDV